MYIAFSILGELVREMYSTCESDYIPCTKVPHCSWCKPEYSSTQGCGYDSIVGGVCDPISVLMVYILVMMDCRILHTDVYVGELMFYKSTSVCMVYVNVITSVFYILNLKKTLYIPIHVL